MQALLVLGLLTLLPGLALAIRMDPEGGRFRHWCAAPALGLVLHGAVFGLIVLCGLWSFAAACVAVLALQVWGAWALRRNGEPPLPSERDAWFHAQRSHGRMWVGGGIAALALLPVLAADVPQGVDWVGFTALAHHLMERGALLSASGHRWIYPPGLPALIGFLGQLTGASLPGVGLAVGQFTLVALMLGMLAAMDRHGAGGEAVLAMVLAVGVFSKVLDSGWPTVASLALLPLNLGRLLEGGHARAGKRLGVLISALATALIHPAGALLLLLLLIADVACAGLAKGPLVRARLDVAVLGGMVLLLIGVALLSQDVRLDAPFAEDGWQGGWPMLAYGSPLLLLAAWAGWRLRGHHESRLLVLWLLLIWGLSLVHLLPEGLRGPAVNNLGSGLYAMGMYAFHLPAAALVALWWSDSTALQAGDLSPNFFVVEGDPCPPRAMAVGLVILVVLGSALATAGMTRLWEHEETLAIGPGDLEVGERLLERAGSALVYAEQAPWGEAMAFTGLNVTAGVDLGVHDGPTDIHLRATQAVLTDNVAVMEELDLQWAVSSPLGALGWVLERSPWWEQVDEVSGSRSWQLRAAPAPHFLGAAPVAAESCDASHCSMRPDPWAGQRWNDVHGLGDMRAVIDAPASVTLTVEQPGDLPSVPVLMCLHVERLGALESGEVRLGDWVADLAGAAGHDRLCGEGEPSNELTVLLNDERNLWLDPAGASGRSDRLLSSDGLRLHAITFHHL